jgi:hypothetical protein
MTYELKFEQKPTCLHAVVTGEISAQNGRRYVEQVMAARAGPHPLRYQVTIGGGR